MAQSPAACVSPSCRSGDSEFPVPPGCAVWGASTKVMPEISLGRWLQSTDRQGMPGRKERKSQASWQEGHSRQRGISQAWVERRVQTLLGNPVSRHLHVSHLLGTASAQCSSWPRLCAVTSQKEWNCLEIMNGHQVFPSCRPAQWQWVGVQSTPGISNSILTRSAYKTPTLSSASPRSSVSALSCCRLPAAAIPGHLLCPPRWPVPGGLTQNPRPGAYKTAWKRRRWSRGVEAARKKASGSRWSARLDWAVREDWNRWKRRKGLSGEKDTGEQAQHRCIIATHRGRLRSLPLSAPGAAFLRNHSIWEVAGTSGSPSSCPRALEMRRKFQNVPA